MGNKGQITKINAGFFYVKFNNEIYTLRGSGNLRLKGIKPLVGDIVKFEKDGFVYEILERDNYFDRPKVANVDQIFVVFSLKDPKYKSYLLNKYLAIIEEKRIKPIILFTKSDISDLEPDIEYRKNGYLAYRISNQTFENIEEIKHLFKNKLSAFVGQSGVGKSSTINSLTGLNIKTDIISKSLKRGKHTTRVTEIHEFLGGQLIDTPGFSSINFELTDLELSKSYKDFNTLSKLCKFKNCLHKFEIDCAIKIAVSENKISLLRYNDYIKLLDEVKNG